MPPILKSHFDFAWQVFALVLVLRWGAVLRVLFVATRGSNRGVQELAAWQHGELVWGAIKRLAVCHQPIWTAHWSLVDPSLRFVRNYVICR